MISKAVQNYIDEHSFCPECLFGDWDSFLNLLYSEGGRVSSIRWWDHCCARMSHTTEPGGFYPDPLDPESGYSRTWLIEEGFENYPLEELKNHILKRRELGLILYDKTFRFDLVPAFTLRKE